MAYLCTIAFIIFIVFLVFTIKKAKKKENFKKDLIICAAALVLAIIFAGLSPSTDTDNTDSSTQGEAQSASAAHSEDATPAGDASDTEDTSNAGAASSAEETSSGGDASEEPEADALVIDIVAGELGEYGQKLVLNEDTDSPTETIGYFIPAGTYEIKNVGEHPTQANIYKNEKTVTDAGWEEWADGTVERVDVGATVTMTIEDGYFFNCGEPSHFTLTQVN